MSTKKPVYVLLIISAFASCNLDNNKLKQSLDSITAEGMKSRISVLASDEFLGRAPATAGEEKY